MLIRQLARHSRSIASSQQFFRLASNLTPSPPTSPSPPPPPPPPTASDLSPRTAIPTPAPTPTPIPISSIASDALDKELGLTPSSSSSSSSSGRNRTTNASHRGKSSSQKSREFRARLGLGFITAAGAYFLFDLGREWEDASLSREGEGRWDRISRRLADQYGYWAEPPVKVLLPPIEEMRPDGQQQKVPGEEDKRLTLVLELNGMLVKQEWDRFNGYRIVKRKGVDYFLKYLSQFYEIVLFSSQPFEIADPIFMKLQPYCPIGYMQIAYQLYRQHCTFQDGKTFKDLSYLGRNMARVVCLDYDPEMVPKQPENTIIIPEWKGDPEDTGLIDIIPLLEAFAFYKPHDPPDVRQFIPKYAGKDAAAEYMKIENSQRQAERQRLVSSQGSSTKSGYKSIFSSSKSKSDAKPVELHIDRVRRFFQNAYKEQMDNEAGYKVTLDKMMDVRMAEIKKMQDEMAPSTLFGWIQSFSEIGKS